MEENQQQNQVEDTQTSTNSNTPDSSSSASASEMYEQACNDIKNLPALGRIALALCIIVILFKMTPILDLVWLFLQIVVIPCLLLISVGLLSNETYMLFIGWLNESLLWARNKRNELQQEGAS